MFNCQKKHGVLYVSRLQSNCEEWIIDGLLSVSANDYMQDNYDLVTKAIETTVDN